MQKILQIKRKSNNHQIKIRKKNQMINKAKMKKTVWEMVGQAA